MRSERRHLSDAAILALHPRVRRPFHPLSGNFSLSASSYGRKRCRFCSCRHRISPACIAAARLEVATLLSTNTLNHEFALHGGLCRLWINEPTALQNNFVDERNFLPAWCRDGRLSGLAYIITMLWI